MKPAASASVEAVFASDGPLAKRLPGFEGRAGQVRMAQLVERGILEGVHTIVEAGTGVGKSLAYLVPAIRSGKKVVVSTGTIALQEQLVHKDLPLVLDALESPVRVVLLKGRNNYLCKDKLARLQTDRLIAPSATMGAAWDWAARTTTGDRAELATSLGAHEWEALDADADDCLGELCGHFRECWFFRQRDAARYADIVVVNHALFFLDLAAGGTLLPPYDVAILDEAHQCEKWATAALTSTISQRSIARLMRRMHRTYTLPNTFDIEIDDCMRGLSTVLAMVPGDRYPLGANEEAPTELDRLRAVLYRLENWVHANWLGALARPAEEEAEAERRRDLALRGILAHVTAIERTSRPADESISWVERGEGDGRYEVNSAPFEVAEFLRAQLFERTESVVLTSATLALGKSFEFLKGSLGITDAQEYVAPLAFDYREQARLFVAPPQCNPKLPEFARRVAPIVEECLDLTRGRAFVLFTSYSRLREVYSLVAERLPYPKRMQGDLPRAHLLEWFRHTRNAVLFATGTFWEGIDVIGDQLSCVIIDRLPFPPPDDPLVAARFAAIEAAGRSGFAEYMIPTAIVRLKQGFGRLIRSRSDRGVIVLLDGRVGSMRYGQTILDALPPARRVEELSALRGFL